MNAAKLKLTTSGPEEMSWGPVIVRPLRDDEGLNEFFSEQEPETVILPIPGPELLRRSTAPFASPEAFGTVQPQRPGPEPLERKPSPFSGPESFDTVLLPLPGPELLEREPSRCVSPEPFETNRLPFPGSEPQDCKPSPLAWSEPFELNQLPVSDPEPLDHNPSLVPGPEPSAWPPLPLSGPELFEPNPPSFAAPEPVSPWWPPVQRLPVSWPWLLLIVAATVETLYIGIHAVNQYRQSNGSVARAALPARLLANPMTTSLPAAPVRVPSPPAAEAKPRPVEPARIEPRPAREPEETPTADPPGWATIDLPIQIQVFEKGRFVGTNDAGRLMLAAGFHELEFANESLQFRARQTVYIGSGKVVSIQVPLPSGTLSLNALPWSDVLVDGKALGATPLGHVQLSIGPHQLVFRHPQLGEQTRTAIVAAGAETRVTVDLRK